MKRKRKGKGMERSKVVVFVKLILLRLVFHLSLASPRDSGSFRGRRLEGREG